MSNSVIRVNNITKIYPLYNNKRDRLKEALSINRTKYHTDFYALKNVSFSVNKGECIGIIGKNGSGKSTLLKILTGVLTQNFGTYEINGKVSALLELGAGFNPEYTGIENIYLNGSIMGFTREQMKTRVHDILNFADIGDFINQPVKTYSSGMFVRLAFAVAINVDPDILIVDEALSVGDIFFQLKCYKKFNDFRKSGKTIIFVTHDLGSVSKYCQRAIFMADGKLVADGNPKEIIDKYKKSIVGFELDKNDLTAMANCNSTTIKTKLSDSSKSDIPWIDSLKKNPESLIYGNYKAEIIDYGVFDNEDRITTTLMKNSTFSLKLKIKFNENVTDPIYAFTIKDVRGTEITGTNTLLEQIDTGKRSKGEIVIVDFKQNMTLQGGPYFISFGCTNIDKESGLEVYHRIYDVVNIDIISSKVSNGYFDMNSEINIEPFEKE